MQWCGSRASRPKLDAIYIEVSTPDYNHFADLAQKYC
jgi:hypothetical protein